MISEPLRRVASTTSVPSDEARDDAIALREEAASAARRPARTRRRAGPRSRDRRRASVVCSRGKITSRPLPSTATVPPSSAQRAAMARAVDAGREPARDRQPALRRDSARTARAVVAAVSGRAAAADHRELRLRESSARPAAFGPERERRRVNLGEPLRMSARLPKVISARCGPASHARQRSICASSGDCELRERLVGASRARADARASFGEQSFRGAAKSSARRARQRVRDSLRCVQQRQPGVYAPRPRWPAAAAVAVGCYGLRTRVEQRDAASWLP